jgi:hypothetical protein
MQVVQQILFLLALAAAGYFIGQRIKTIRNTILLGRDEDRSDRPEERRAMMLRIAFGQQKMFDRPLIGLMHFVVYAGFLLINVEVLEIVLDGLWVLTVYSLQFWVIPIPF